MDTDTRRLAHRVTLALQKLEGAVLSLLPAEQRREAALSPAFCEFRAALQEISDPSLRVSAPQQEGFMGSVPPLRVTGAGDALVTALERAHNWPTSTAWEQEATEMGLHVLRHNDGAHVQFVQDGKRLADWWPGKGTTLMDGKRGPSCRTGEAVIAWLKEA